MTAVKRGIGFTPTERNLAALADKIFLNLWTYPNLLTGRQRAVRLARSLRGRRACLQRQKHRVEKGQWDYRGRVGTAARSRSRRHRLTVHPREEGAADANTAMRRDNHC